MDYNYKYIKYKNKYLNMLKLNNDNFRGGAPKAKGKGKGKGKGAAPRVLDPTGQQYIINAYDTKDTRSNRGNAILQLIDAANIDVSITYQELGEAAEVAGTAAFYIQGSEQLIGEAVINTYLEYIQIDINHVRALAIADAIRAMIDTNKATLATVQEICAEAVSSARVAGTTANDRDIINNNQQGIVGQAIINTYLGYINLDHDAARAVAIRDAVDAIITRHKATLATVQDICNEAGNIATNLGNAYNAYVAIDVDPGRGVAIRNAILAMIDTNSATIATVQAISAEAVSSARVAGTTANDRDIINNNQQGIVGQAIINTYLGYINLDHDAARAVAIRDAVDAIITRHKATPATVQEICAEAVNSARVAGTTANDGNIRGNNQQGIVGQAIINTYLGYINLDHDAARAVAIRDAVDAIITRHKATPATVQEICAEAVNSARVAGTTANDGNIRGNNQQGIVGQAIINTYLGYINLDHDAARAVAIRDAVDAIITRHKATLATVQDICNEAGNIATNLGNAYNAYVAIDNDPGRAVAIRDAIVAMINTHSATIATVQAISGEANNAGTAAATAYDRNKNVLAAEYALNAYLAEIIAGNNAAADAAAVREGERGDREIQEQKDAEARQKAAIETERINRIKAEAKAEEAKQEAILKAKETKKIKEEFSQIEENIKSEIIKSEIINQEIINQEIIKPEIINQEDIKSEIIKSHEQSMKVLDNIIKSNEQTIVIIPEKIEKSQEQLQDILKVRETVNTESLKKMLDSIGNIQMENLTRTRNLYEEFKNGTLKLNKLIMQFGGDKIKEAEDNTKKVRKIYMNIQKEMSNEILKFIDKQSDAIKAFKIVKDIVKKIKNKEILTSLILSELDVAIKVSKDVIAISNNISELKNKLEIEENKVLLAEQEEENIKKENIKKENIKIKKSDDIYDFNNFYDYTIYLNNIYNLRKHSFKHKKSSNSPKKSKKKSKKKYIKN